MRVRLRVRVRAWVRVRVRVRARARIRARVRARGMGMGRLTCGHHATPLGSCGALRLGKDRLLRARARAGATDGQG